MGFFSLVGSIVKDTVKGVSEKNKKAIAIADEYRGKDDAFLRNKYKSGRIEEKMAAGKVLKEKGEL